MAGRDWPRRLPATALRHQPEPALLLLPLTLLRLSPNPLRPIYPPSCIHLSEVSCLSFFTRSCLISFLFVLSSPLLLSTRASCSPEVVILLAVFGQQQYPIRDKRTAPHLHTYIPKSTNSAYQVPRHSVQAIGLDAFILHHYSIGSWTSEASFILFFPGMRDRSFA